MQAVCVNGCGRAQEWRCDTYGCTHCGEAKRRRLQRVIEDGSSAHVATGLRGYFLTLTAPGHRDHRRWFQGRPPADRPDCHCHQHGLTPGGWNSRESANWNRLRTALARDRLLIYAGSVETQRRGMLHRHVVVFTDGHLDFSEVQQLALAAGYGCVVDVERLESPAKAARYLSKYVSKSAGQRPDVPWSGTELDLETGELVEVPTRATFRLWSSSHRWGVTMKQVKQTAALQARARAMYLRELAAFLEADGSGPGSRIALESAPAGDSATDPP